MTFMASRFYEAGDKITLDDGTEVVVIGTHKEAGDEVGMVETIHVGNIF